MAFTGVAVIKQVDDDLIRITGLSLAANASGVIGLHEKTVAPGVRLPASFKPREYKGAEGQDVGLQDSLEVMMVPVTSQPAAVPTRVEKTGTTPQDLAITLTNNHLSGTATPELEIYIRFH